MGRRVGSELDGILVTRSIVKGNPAREIPRTTHNENCDLILIPTHGYRALRGFLMGSVTAEVL